FKSTQLSPHFWKPCAQAVLHEPLAQMAGAVQALPQTPQLLFSDCRLTHAPLHGVRPDWHMSWLPAGPAAEPPLLKEEVGAGPSICAVQAALHRSSTTRAANRRDQLGGRTARFQDFFM